MSDTPLFVRVAEAIGWTDCEKPARFMVNGRDLGEGVWSGTPPGMAKPQRAWPIPRFDREWMNTGPLVERYEIRLTPPTEPERTSPGCWEATRWLYPDGWDGRHYGDVESVAALSTNGALEAACKLIVKLAAEGKL